MINLKLLRENLEKVKQAVASRGPKSLKAAEEFIENDSLYRAVLAQAEKLRARSNEISGEIKKHKIAGNEKEAEKCFAEANKIKAEMKHKESELSVMRSEIKLKALLVPNIPHPSVPIGESETDNIIIAEYPENKKDFGFEISDHHALGEKLEILDFKKAAALAGSRFALLKGAGAKLERALAQFMLDTHEAAGYTEIVPPFLANPKTMTGAGQLPKFEEDLYKTKGENPLYLIPTAEVPLANIGADSVFDEDDLPFKYSAHTPCFRREAGSYGKDTRGLIRNHQFGKVELVWLVRPEDSMAALEKLREDAEKILKLLKMPYRVIELCAADLGFSSGKTYDLEVWMPAEKRFREISSCSNCFDFQARRMNAKFKRKSGGKPEFVHTLNGSGLAVGRTFAAILENFQNSDGSVTVPEVLRKYTGIAKIL